MLKANSEIKFLIIFTEEERQNETIIIEKLTREKDNERFITVWYQETLKELFIPKDTIIWKKGAEY